MEISCHVIPAIILMRKREISVDTSIAAKGAQPKVACTAPVLCGRSIGRRTNSLRLSSRPKQAIRAKQMTVALGIARSAGGDVLRGACCRRLAGAVPAGRLRDREA